MPTIEVNAKNLLDAVKQLAPEEFDALIDQAFSARSRTTKTRLSAEETKLIQRINLGLAPELSKRYTHLIGRRKRGRLTAKEHQELLQLVHEAESRDADRAAALLELAKFRRLPVRILMKQMGIQPPEIHG
jgi:hypothetical protein